MRINLWSVEIMTFQFG
ncbi:Putative uncharacterized protein [Escherichia coli D6-117.29]|nr:Protein of unknown function [Escherichia coli]CDP75493.1 Putative uncharacterized protein [Escherichia coli D6-117.29]CDU40863.1 Protein of unknown function [Escherichia coli]